MRRCRIHGDNIVSLLHGIALISCISSAEFKVYYHYVIKINSINALNTWHIPPFLECTRINIITCTCIMIKLTDT